jgi:hypothetical protein
MLASEMMDPAPNILFMFMLISVFAVVIEVKLFVVCCRNGMMVPPTRDLFTVAPLDRALVMTLVAPTRLDNGDRATASPRPLRALLVATLLHTTGGMALLMSKKSHIPVVHFFFTSVVIFYYFLIVIIFQLYAFLMKK